jgi:porin
VIHISRGPAARRMALRGLFGLSLSPLALMLAAPAAAQSPADDPAVAVDEAEEAPPAVDLSVVYTADIWRNMRGGLRRGWRYLDNLDVTLTVDAERALGWNGATIFLYGLYNNGNSLTDDLVGDAQVVSNIDAGVRAARLYEAWVEQRFAGDRGSVKVGLYDLNSEFDATDSGGLFINSSHGIGPDFSQTGQNGPSIFPSTSLAMRVDYALTDNWIVRAAVLDGVPGDPNRPKRTTIKLGNGDGALLVGEVNYVDDDTKVALGHWRYTARFDDLVATQPDLSPVRRRGNDGFYMLAERRLTREAEDDAQGLSGWVRLGVADKRVNPVQRYIGGGLVYTGPIAGRDEDQLGIAVGHIDFGSPYRQAVALAGDPPVRNEMFVELTYRAAITDWLTLQPDVQYIANPGGSNALRDAVVVGLRTEIGF